MSTDQAHRAGLSAIAEPLVLILLMASQTTESKRE